MICTIKLGKNGPTGGSEITRQVADLVKMTAGLSVKELRYTQRTQAGNLVKSQLA